MSVIRGAIGFKCDACGVVNYQQSKHDEKPEGFHGTLHEISNGGGPMFQWYACSIECLPKAVVVVASRDVGQSP